MYKFSKILVGLDHTEMDEDLILAASEICKLSGASEIYFVNILKDLSLPESILKEFPNLLDQAIEERKKSLQEKVNRIFDYKAAKIEISVMVQTGQVTKAILQFASDQKTDLIVLGRKNEKKNGGVLISRIARRAGCSLLILPKGSKFKLDHILVPTDFSDYAKKAMEKAVTFAKRYEGESQILVQNVYQVPAGYHYTGKSYKEFAVVMKENAMKDYKKFIAEFNLKGVYVDHIYTLDKDDDIISDIYKTAKKEKADIIIIGAKGRSATTALFIGSAAERLIQVDTEIPMLVIRPKGKRAGLLEYIKDL